MWRKMIWDMSAATAPFRGKERLVGMLSRPGDLGLVRVERAGVRWLLKGHDLNEFYLAVRPYHSPTLIGQLSAEVERTGVRVLWDIGANIGAVSLPLLKKFPSLDAVLFEPSAEVAGRLIRNLSLNADLCGRAQIMNVALSEAGGLTRFYVSNESENSGVGGLGVAANRLQTAVQVQAYTGDSLVADGTCPVPQLIKIDVEGFEFEAFKGLRRTLVEHHPTIVFEHSVYRFTERGRPIDEVTGFLESLGYAIFTLDDGRRITAADLARDADFIARAA